MSLKSENVQSTQEKLRSACASAQSDQSCSCDVWSGSTLFAQTCLFHTLKGVYWETNSVDADQTLGKAASDVGLHCLPNQVCLNA